MDREKYTRKQRDILLLLRKSPRTFDGLMKDVGVNQDAMNIMLSDLGHLYYVEDDKPTRTGTLKLNHIGETVAQAEYDHRFEVYYSRAISFLSLTVSIVALAVSFFR